MAAKWPPGAPWNRFGCCPEDRRLDLALGVFILAYQVTVTGMHSAGIASRRIRITPR